MASPPPYLVEDLDVPALRQVISSLVRIGYSEKSICDRLGLEDLADIQWRALPMYREERLAAREPLDLAIDLFLLQTVLPGDELNRLLNADDREVLAKSGLLAIHENGDGCARASLFPVGHSLIFSDHAWPELPHPGVTAVPYDQVMFVGPDSRALARCTPRRRVKSALDLCTGSGIQALLAAAHADQVLAVDINERAACCTRFNAKTLGASNLEVAVGDVFDPAGGQCFDLITANPPFVPSPLSAVAFRDGGPSGEDIQKRIVAGLPQHLAQGGTAQMVTELGERDGEPLTDRLRDWLNGALMDIHVLRLREYPAIKYAIGHAKGDSYSEFLDSVQAWGGNLRAHGYRRVVAILISFQWSEPTCGVPWESVDESPLPHRAGGAEIEATFLAERLARHPDLIEALKHSRLRLAGPVALVDAQLLGGAISASAKARLLGQALTIEHQLNPVEREVLRRVE